MAFGMPAVKKKVSPMVDKGMGKKKDPKAGEDFDPKTKVAGTAPIGDRDGPAKRHADPTPQKPATSAKATAMAAKIMKDMPTPTKAVSQGIAAQSSAPASMPSAAQVASMKKSIKGMSGGFKR